VLAYSVTLRAAINPKIYAEVCVGYETVEEERGEYGSAGGTRWLRYGMAGRGYSPGTVGPQSPRRFRRPRGGHAGAGPGEVM